MNTQTLFIILARGGSKRLPGKSLRTVGGIPLIVRTVRNARATAKRLNNPTKVIVNTDSDAIADTARKAGATTPFLRPAHLATDDATTMDVLRHVLAEFRARNESFTEIVLMQPTSPLTLPRDVLSAIERFRQDPARSVVTVRPQCPNDPTTIRFDLGCDLDDNLDGNLDGGCHSGGDILNAPMAAPGDPRAVALNGAVYVFSPGWLASRNTLSQPGTTRGVPMPTERSADVDTASDLEAAQRDWARSIPWQREGCLLIAEAGVNHNGQLDIAKRLIEAAAQAGADAVKFQTFSATRLVTPSATKAPYQQRTTASNESQYDMLRQLELAPEDHRALVDCCGDHDILFLSSAFGEEDVDLLDALEVAAIKIGSAEITNHPMLAHAGSTGRPIILSTGGSYLAEVANAVEVLRRSGCFDLALLHCTSAYPAPFAELNLRAMDTLRDTFHVPIGFSDHSQGITAAVAAVARGACIVEKHFTLDRAMPGPDHQASIEPKQLAELVRSIRNVEAALGDGIKRPTGSESGTRQAARKSLVATRDLKANTVLEPADLAAKRPAGGVSPEELHRVVGQRLARKLTRDEPLRWDDLSTTDDPSATDDSSATGDAE